MGISSWVSLWLAVPSSSVATRLPRARRRAGEAPAAVDGGPGLTDSVDRIVAEWTPSAPT